MGTYYTPAQGGYMRYDISIKVTIDIPDMDQAQEAAGDLVEELGEKGWGCLHCEVAEIVHVEWDKISPATL
jgi:hypothetical protein